MKVSIDRCFMKFHAAGRVTIMAKTFRKYAKAVRDAMRIPGVLTVELALNSERFANGLFKNDIPENAVQSIKRSLQIFEREAYFIPTEDSWVIPEEEFSQGASSESEKDVCAEAKKDGQEANTPDMTPYNICFEESGTWRMDDRILKKTNAPEAIRIEAVLASIARQECMILGAALNSPIHESLLKVCRQAWMYGINTVE
jgi:hypothetical protein